MSNIASEAIGPGQRPSTAHSKTRLPAGGSRLMDRSVWERVRVMERNIGATARLT